MLLQQNNLYTKVVRATDEELVWLKRQLTFDNAKKAYFSGGPDKISIFNIVDQVFPSGPLPEVLKAAIIDKVTIQVMDVRKAPCVPLGREEAPWLRDYQHEAVDAVLAATRGILWLGTGAGKSECAVALAKRAPVRWVFAVHRTMLAAQAAERFMKRVEESLGCEVGFIGNGKWQPGRRFTVATLQTLYKAISKRDKQDWFDSIEGLIIDEAHVLPADTFMQTAMRFRKAYYRVGLSGTPLDRKDKRSFYSVAALGPVVYSYTAGDLVEDGVLAKPRIHMVPVKQAGAYASWDAAYKALVAQSGERNRSVVAVAQKARKPALVFVKLVEHGKRLAKMMTARGLKADFVWGSDSLSSRQNAVKRLVRRDLDVLVCSVIFNEGVDIPELASVVVAAGGDSVISTLQRIGRGMRKADGKETFEVWDFEDIGNKWLERHSKERKRAYLRERFDVFITPITPVTPLPEEAPRGTVGADEVDGFFNLTP